MAEEPSRPRPTFGYYKKANSLDNVIGSWRGGPRPIPLFNRHQSAPDRRSEITDVSLLINPPHLSTRLRHILRRLLGSRMRRLVCIAALLGSVAVVKARSSPGSSTDSRVDALLSVKRTFGYNQLLSDTWMGNDPCEGWYGVNCLDGQIMGITLSFMNLTGSISKRFADITSLHELDLSFNRLTGTIPSELTKPVLTPMASSPKLHLNSGVSLSDPTKYRRLIGSLQYLQFTRLDIAYAVNKLSQFMHKPTEDHWQAAKRILRYLAGTPTHGIFYSATNKLTLHAYSDADWAGDCDDYVSTNSYIIYLGRHPISWTSKKQNGVARSSTEAEYRSVANTASELSWICNILSELGISLNAPPVVYCDNVGATFLCANPVFHSRMKHIAIDYHFVRNQVQRGAMRVAHVNTRDQLADALTKPLTRARFVELRNKIGVRSLAPS